MNSKVWKLLTLHGDDPLVDNEINVFTVALRWSVSESVVLASISWHQRHYDILRALPLYIGVKLKY